MNKLKQTLEKILKKEGNFIDSESGEVDYIKVKDSANKIDEKLIILLVENKELKTKFFTKIKDVFVFNTQDFKFFLDESKIDNSYTKYSIKIGLSDGDTSLESKNEVALDFPFKDSVLEGGQSSEEGTDTYFEYSNKTDIYEEKQARRNEVFFNQVLAHNEIDRLFDRKALINWKRFTKNSGKNGEKVKEIRRDKSGLIKENLIVKGNNLLALHSLKSEFAGKIKLIYIDPPYYFDKDKKEDSFAYNSNFKLSTWLTFMKNRLEVAEELLSDDGVIFVQITDDGHAHLKLLMDSIFKKYHTSICVKMSHMSGVKMAHKDKKIPKVKEYVLMYTKNESIKLKPQYEVVEWNDALNRYTSFLEKGNYDDSKCGKWKVITLNEAIKKAGISKNDNSSALKFKIENADLIFRTSRNRSKDYSNLKKNVFTKIVNPDESYYFSYKHEDVNFASEKVLEIDGIKYPVNSVGDIWLDIGINNLSNEGGVDLRFGKKPEKLLHRLIDMTTNEEDIVLDYHLGSGTTCAVAHKMNRQYIGIEQLDYGDNDSVVRINKVIDADDTGVSKVVNWKGGGEFIYFELAKWNEQAKEEINKAKDYSALVKLFDSLYEKYFLNYNVKIKDFKEKIIKEENFKKLSLTEQKRMFLTMLDLNQMYVQESEMSDKKFDISKEDQKLTKAFYKKK